MYYLVLNYTWQMRKANSSKSTRIEYIFSQFANKTDIGIQNILIASASCAWEENYTQTQYLHNSAVYPDFKVAIQSALNVQSFLRPPNWYRKAAIQRSYFILCYPVKSIWHSTANAFADSHIEYILPHHPRRTTTTTNYVVR